MLFFFAPFSHSFFLALSLLNSLFLRPAIFLRSFFFILLPFSLIFFFKLLRFLRYFFCFCFSHALFSSSHHFFFTFAFLCSFSFFALSLFCTLFSLLFCFPCSFFLALTHSFLLHACKRKPQKAPGTLLWGLLSLIATESVQKPTEKCHPML